MNRPWDSWLALLAHAAPLLGFLLWLSPVSFSGGGGWDFIKMFSLGLYMAAMGLAVPAVIWLAVRPGMAEAQAFSSLKFHAVVALIVVIFGLLLLIATWSGPANPTMGKPPANFQAVLTIVAVLSAFVLPFVELGRVVYGVRLILRLK